MCNCNGIKSCGPECCKAYHPGAAVPNKHAAVIKAWADGAKIEMLAEPGRWIDCPCPAWFSAATYRVKPTPKPLEDVAHDAFYASCNKEFGGHHWRAVADAVVAEYRSRRGETQ